MAQQSVESCLDEFVAQGLITEVLNAVKSGKEATVYRCLAGPAAGPGVDLLAAKVYRPLESRGFRNDAVYQEGRFVPKKSGGRQAFQRRTDWGRHVQSTGWVAAEYQTLCTLYAAGVDTPRPFLRAGAAILMEYVGDAAATAPVLSHVSLPPGAAGGLFDRLIGNVARCLAHHCVHGDLSPFNILYWEGAPKIIDFPQAVDPRFNHNASTLLERDVTNVCRYFSRYGVDADPAQVAEGLWERYVRGELT